MTAPDRADGGEPLPIEQLRAYTEDIEGSTYGGLFSDPAAAEIPTLSGISRPLRIKDLRARVGTGYGAQPRDRRTV